MAGKLELLALENPLLDIQGVGYVNCFVLKRHVQSQCGVSR